MPDRIYLSPPHVGAEERELLLAAFDSGWLAPLGAHVDGFEREMQDTLGVRRAVALSSGSAALHLALIVVGVRPGDHVVVPTLTFAATANAVVQAGATPIFVDCDEKSWTLDPSLLDRALRDARRAGKHVAAVVTVDLYGQTCDYDAIRSACDDAGVPVVEDAAEALGSTHGDRAAGSLGTVGILSFNGNKILTTSGGGMLVTDEDILADRVRHLATQAREPVLHYEHREVGYNYRLSNLLAAIGRAQLRRLPERVDARRENFRSYDRAFRDVPGLTMMPQDAFGASNCWLSTLLIEPDKFGVTARDVCGMLEGADIEARPAWKPMHLQPVFRHLGCVGGAVSEDIFNRGLCLPSGSSLQPAQLERVVAAVLDCRGMR